MTDRIKVAVAQVAPVWLDRAATVTRVADAVAEAGRQGAQLVSFGEALIPGYPAWVERTGGARFDAADQKRWYAHYVDQAVDLDRGDLDAVCFQAMEHKVAVWLGIIERGRDRGGVTVYATVLHIDATGVIRTRHRKLMPTHEERLVWGIGDGHGLNVETVGPARTTALNCWENWMPLARASLYAQGTEIHSAIWPGSRRNTDLITPFIAREGRCFVISASALLRATDIGDHVPDRAALQLADDTVLNDGGSCICGPDGRYLVDPLPAEERVVTVELDLAEVRGERQSFDASGHYSRPDVFTLKVNRRPQRIARFEDS